MTDSPAPVAGWYDDPHMALRLRWWDGARWTQHTRAKTVVVHPAEQQISGAPTAASTVIAEPAVTEPYGFSAPYSWSPRSVTAATAGTPASPRSPVAPDLAAPAAVASPAAQDLWNSAATAVDYTPERTTTPAAWALAVTPIVTALAQLAAGVLSGFESTPLVWTIAATVIPILWIIVWVRRDRIMLHEWGHLRRAHWAWAFLGALGYLVARTIVVRRQSTGRGWWPLIVNLAITAVLVNVGLFTPVLGVLRTTLF